MADPAEERYRALLERPGLTLGEVQEACFRGIPDRLRAPFWKLLLGAMPLEVAARDVALAVSRQRYREFLAEVTTNPCADDDGCDGDGSGGGGGGGGRRRHRARGSGGGDGGGGGGGSPRARSGRAAGGGGGGSGGGSGSNRVAAHVRRVWWHAAGGRGRRRRRR